MFDKLTHFLTLACVLSTALATPIPQTTATTTSNENFQPFTGNLGGDVAPSVIRSDDGFTVQGKGTFTDLASALAASCDILKAQCTNATNSAAGRASGLTLVQCDQQDVECRAAIAGVSDPDASPPLIEGAAKDNNLKSLRGRSVRRAPAGGNVQPFSGALGGQPPAVTASGQRFQVAGGQSFADLASALAASCSLQLQNCLNAKVPAAQCNAQATQCRSAASTSAKNPRALEARQIRPPPPPTSPPPPPPAPRPRSEDGLEAGQVPPPQNPPRPRPPVNRPRDTEAFEKRQGQPGGRGNSDNLPPPQGDNGNGRVNNNNQPPPPVDDDVPRDILWPPRLQVSSPPSPEEAELSVPTFREMRVAYSEMTPATAQMTVRAFGMATVLVVASTAGMVCATLWAMGTDNFCDFRQKIRMMPPRSPSTDVQMTDNY